MEIYIDISVFLPTSNLGVIHGHLNVEYVPKVGEYFSWPIKDETYANVKELAIVKSPLKVERIVESGEQNRKLVMLQDLILESKDEWHKTCDYLEKDCGLYFDDHN